MKEEDKTQTLSLEMLRKVVPSRSALLKGTLFILLFFSFYLVYLTITPFLHLVILSILVSGMLYPVYVFVSRYIPSKSIAAVIVLILLIVGVVVLATVIVAFMIPEIIRSIDVIQTELAKKNIEYIVPVDLLETITNYLHTYFPFLEFNTVQLQENIILLLKTAGQVLLKNITTLLRNFVYFVVNFFIFLVIVFFLLRDGYDMLQRLQELVPMSFANFERITQSLRRVARAVFVGGFLVALVQGIVASLGFWYAGYSALLGGVATALASLIPVFGTGLVWLPFSIYLFLVEGTNTALVFLLWNIILVTNLDTFLRPYFMSGNVGSSVLFIFLSILGGVQAFGALGIIYGPLILAFAMVMVDIYSDEYLRKIKKDTAVRDGA